MSAKLIRTLLFFALLLFTAVGAAQAEAPARVCPDLSAAELRQSVGSTAQAFQEDAQRLNRSLNELEPPKLKDLSKIQPDQAMQSLGEQANRVKGLEWREGAGALASGAVSSVTKGWQGVKENVVPATARCVQQWTGRASNVVENAPVPNLTEPVQEPSDSSGTPERLEPAPLPVPELEVATGVLDSVRRAVMNRVTQHVPIQEVGSGVIDTLADAFPTVFRLIKYYVIWVLSTSILVTVLLLIILTRLTYILLFSSKRSEGVK